MSQERYGIRRFALLATLDLSNNGLTHVEGGLELPLLVRGPENTDGSVRSLTIIPHKWKGGEGLLGVCVCVCM
jgi:hypothetical protein